MKNALTDVLKVVERKFVVIIAIVFGFLYSAVFLFATGISYGDTFATLGSIFRSTYISWALVNAVALAIGMNYVMARYSLRNKVSYIAILVGAVAMIVNACLPCTKDTPIVICRWVFGVVFACSYLLAYAYLMIKGMKNSKGFLITAIIFGVICLADVILMRIFGVRGYLEAIPLWTAFILLFLQSFSGLFGNGENLEEEKESVKEIVLEKGLTDDYENFLAEEKKEKENQYNKEKEEDKEAERSESVDTSDQEHN